ncbi:hypothetical protein ACWD6R_30125 [Streptomyces sp. NPDC005151]
MSTSANRQIDALSDALDKNTSDIQKLKESVKPKSPTATLLSATSSVVSASVSASLAASIALFKVDEKEITILGTTRKFKLLNKQISDIQKKIENGDQKAKRERDEFIQELQLPCLSNQPVRPPQPQGVSPPRAGRFSWLVPRSVRRRPAGGSRGEDRGSPQPGAAARAALARRLDEVEKPGTDRFVVRKVRRNRRRRTAHSRKYVVVRTARHSAVRITAEGSCLRHLRPTGVGFADGLQHRGVAARL